jgi:sec-independent protein translocase protein TatA
MTSAAPTRGADRRGVMSFGLTEIILVALLIVVLFGAKKIPDIMRSLGQGYREVKDITDGLDEEIEDVKKTVSTVKKLKP